jgi:hypothetical protein
LEGDASVDGIHHADGVEFRLEVLEGGAEQVGGFNDWELAFCLSAHRWRGLTKLDQKGRSDDQGRDLAFDGHTDKLADGLPRQCYPCSQHLPCLLDGLGTHLVCTMPSSLGPSETIHDGASNNDVGSHDASKPGDFGDKDAVLLASALLVSRNVQYQKVYELTASINELRL